MFRCSAPQNQCKRTVGAEKGSKLVPSEASAWQKPMFSGRSQNEARQADIYTVLQYERRWSTRDNNVEKESE